MPANNLIVFLKYPEPGKVKTRLAKAVGDNRAADIYSILTKHLLAQLNSGNSYKISVHFSPEEKSIDVSSWLNMEDIVPQKGENLGDKLSSAFDSSFLEGYDNTIIIGTDCIELTTDDIEKAFNYLSSGFDSVVGPTNDGGYYLIGFSGRNYPVLFKNISWSTDEVFNQTMDKITELKINNKVLNYYNDIDEISDINSNVIKIIKSYKPDLRISD